MLFRLKTLRRIHNEKIKLIAFDLDGTLTQHKTKLSPENRAMLEKLAQRYKLLMVGAGQCMRIFNQLDGFPIDVLGNYGMQYGEYDANEKTLKILRDDHLPCDREKTEELVNAFRKANGWTEYAGNNVEFHPSGCITFPILGTAAQQEDKLAFVPIEVNAGKSIRKFAPLSRIIMCL